MRLEAALTMAGGGGGGANAGANSGAGPKAGPGAKAMAAELQRRRGISASCCRRGHSASGGTRRAGRAEVLRQQALLMLHMRSVLYPYLRQSNVPGSPMSRGPDLAIAAITTTNRVSRRTRGEGQIAVPGLGNAPVDNMGLLICGMCHRRQVAHRFDRQLRAELVWAPNPPPRERGLPHRCMHCCKANRNSQNFALLNPSTAG